MMRIGRRAASPAGSATTGPSPSACGAILREACARLAGELPAGVVLGDELNIAVLMAPVFCLVFDPEVRQRKVSVDDRQLVRRGKRPAIVVERGLIGAIPTIEVLLVVALELGFKNDAGHAAALAFNARGLSLVEARELCVMRQLARLDQPRVIALAVPLRPRFLMGVEEGFPVSREDGHGGWAMVDHYYVSFHQALPFQVLQVLARRALGAPTRGEFRFGDHTKRPDRRQGLRFRPPQAIRAASASHGLPGNVARQAEAIGRHRGPRRGVTATVTAARLSTEGRWAFAMIASS